MKDEALKLALEALIGARAFLESDAPVEIWGVNDQAITAIKEALANEALEKKAENARELGLDYEPEVFSKQNYLNGYCVGQLDLLEEQAKQEPAAWMVYTQDGQSVYVTDNPTDIQENQRALPMYTTPPQRTWVGLTEQEQGAIMEDLNAYGTNLYQFARAIEAAHGIKEKNNG